VRIKVEHEPGGPIDREPPRAAGSQEGVGPMAAGAPAAAQPEPSSVAEQQRSVLVVDDDPDFRYQISALLEREGFSVVAVEGEIQAEAALREQRPDLAVVDLIMEHLDGGFALAHRLKRLTPPVPVILVTSLAREAGRDYFEGLPRSWAEHDTILHKPVRLEDLRREIVRLLPR